MAVEERAKPGRCPSRGVTMTRIRSLARVASEARPRVRAGLVAVAVLAATFAVTSASQATSPGTVVGWGGNANGQTTVPTGLAGVTAIAAGLNHSLALKSDGTVVGWGNNLSGQTRVPTNLTGVAAIAAGNSHSLALKSSGTVVA